MTLNATWHKAHPMPRNPTPEQRLAWHLEHAKECTCRPPSAAMLAKLRKACAERGQKAARARGTRAVR